MSAILNSLNLDILMHGHFLSSTLREIPKEWILEL